MENKIIIVDDIAFVRKNSSVIKAAIEKEKCTVMPLSNPVMLFLNSMGIKCEDFSRYEEKAAFYDIYPVAERWANEWVGPWGASTGGKKPRSFGYAIGWSMVFFFCHILQTYILLGGIIKKLKPDQIIFFTAERVDLVRNPVKLQNADPYLIANMLKELSVRPEHKFTLNLIKMPYDLESTERSHKALRQIFGCLNVSFSAFMRVKNKFIRKRKKILFFEGAHHLENIMDKPYLKKYEKLHLEKVIGLSLFFRMYLRGIRIISLSSSSGAANSGYFYDKTAAERYLSDFFIYNGENLFPFVRPRLEYLLNEYFPRVVYRDMNTVAEILVREKPDMVVAENDTTYLERLLIILAKSQGINTAVVQHGATVFAGDAGNRGLMPYDFYPVTADTFFAFGNITKEWFTKMETSNARIVVTGGARFDDYYSTGKMSRKGTTRAGNVLILLNDVWLKEGLVTHYIGLDVFYKHIYEFIKLSGNNPDINFVIRPHDVTHMWKEIFKKELMAAKNIVIEREGELKGVLNRASIVVGYSSTALIESLICGIPILSMDTGEYHNILPLWEYGLSIRIKSFGSLENEIKKLLYTDKEAERALMTMSKNIHLFNYNNDGKAAERISAELDKTLVSS